MRLSPVEKLTKFDNLLAFFNFRTKKQNFRTKNGQTFGMYGSDVRVTKCTDIRQSVRVSDSDDCPKLVRLSSEMMHFSVRHTAVLLQCYHVYFIGIVLYCIVVHIAALQPWGSPGRFLFCLTHAFEQATYALLF